ncbi:LysR family transcriptional regulator [Herbiconiux liukaitaii]|uniref:LysR family transcriptional regulator n=1 Tax=Herbiconiux liukaitaii TaxID=3342799 RepID=UPI0035BA6A83
MDLDVRRLMALRAVRDAGGVLAAAASMHISASAVSQQLSKLERETGLRLLDRSTSGRVRLTVAGVRLCERADAIAAELRTASRELSELSEVRDRTVTVAAFPSVIDTLLIPVARELRHADPPVDLRIIEARDDLNATHAALRAGTLDLAIFKHGEAAPLPEGIVQTIIRDDPYRIVIPAGWPTPTAMTELLDAPWVGHPSGSPGREPLARIEAIEHTTLRYDHECTEYSVALALVEAGLAAAVIPALAIPRTLSAEITVLEFGDLGYRRIAAHHQAGRTAMGIMTLLDALRRSTAHGTT